MARSLEQAVKHSECYENSNNTMTATISHPEAVLVAPIRKIFNSLVFVSSVGTHIIRGCYVRRVTPSAKNVKKKRHYVKYNLADNMGQG